MFLPALAALTDEYGWRVSVALICGALIMVALVVLLLMLRSTRPAQLQTI